MQLNISLALGRTPTKSCNLKSQKLRSGTHSGSRCILGFAVGPAFQPADTAHCRADADRVGITTDRTANPATSAARYRHPDQCRKGADQSECSLHKPTKSMQAHAVTLFRSAAGAAFLLSSQGGQYSPALPPPPLPHMTPANIHKNGRNVARTVMGVVGVLIAHDEAARRRGVQCVYDVDQRTLYITCRV